MSQPQHDLRVPALRTRIAAGLLDFLLVLVASFFLSRGFLVFPMLLVAYHTLSVWLVQQTPGKAVFGLKVQRCDFRPTLLWALGRSSLGLFLVNGMGLGFVIALFNRRRRGIHDYVFGSMVVLEENPLGLKWSARLKDWLRQKNETFAKKTEFVASATGIWKFIKWIFNQMEWAAGQVDRLITFLRGGVETAVATSVPAAATVTEASIIGIVSTAVTATILVVVPGTLEVASYIASPAYYLTQPTDGESILSTVQGPGGVTMHHAVSGSPVLVKAVVNAPPGETLRYTLYFGDGSDPVSQAVNGLAFVSESHEYPEDDARTSYLARIRVTDSEGNEVGSGEYPVEFVEASDEERIVKALDDGLWALNVGQIRESVPGVGPIGYWEHSPPVGATALAALAFEVNGFDSGAGMANPYRDTVDRALRYLLSQSQTKSINVEDAPDPDSNGNGIGITVVDSSQEMYELPMVVMALVASGDPGRVADSGPTNVRGRRYDEIVTDMIDFIAFAQSDSTGGRGGWRYTANRVDGDMSVMQWPVLAMMAAEEQWGIRPPEWVKSELREHFLVATQNPETGQFSYEPGSTTTGVGMTAAGLIALNFVDVPSRDDRVQRAIGYIAENWDTNNGSDYYFMYAVMKAARLHAPPIEEFGEHDWLAEYAQDLTERQNADGTWPNRGRGAGTLATAWPALILSQNIFATGVQIRLRRWFADAF